MTIRSRIISARYAGSCRACFAVFGAGAPVWFAKGYGVRCKACGPHQPGDAPSPAKSTRVKRTGAAMTLDGTVRLAWDSVTDVLVEGLERQDAATEKSAEHLNLRRRHCLRGDEEWMNCHTVESLRRSVVEPRGDIVDAVRSLRERLDDEIALPTRRSRRVRHGRDDGDEIDADRFLLRDPSCWDRVEHRATPARTVRVLCDSGLHCKQKREELLHRGAAAAALADALTIRGLNVEIMFAFAAARPTSTVKLLVASVLVKRADMPLDLNATAFALADLGFFRGAMLDAAMRRLPGKLSKTFGRLYPATTRLQGDYVIGIDVTSEDSAIAWIRRQLATIDTATKGVACA